MNITRDTAREVHTHSRSIDFQGREPEQYFGHTHSGKAWVPSHAYAEWSHGKPIQQITVNGAILKKDGTPGQNRGTQRYCTPANMIWDTNWDTKYGRRAPAWLLELFGIEVPQDAPTLPGLTRGDGPAFA